MAGKLNLLPFQYMTSDVGIQLIPLSELKDELSDVPHRHDFYMIVWTTAGEGGHFIDFEWYKMQPDRVFIINKGQVHQYTQFAEDGWMILFDESLFSSSSDVIDEQFNILNYFHNTPFIDMDLPMREIYHHLFGLLGRELKRNEGEMAIIQQYIMLMLLHANRHLGRKEKAGPHLSADREQLKKIRILLEKNFRKNREIRYYADLSGVSSRKLTALVQKYLGKTFHQLLQDRILIEGRSLLVTTAMTVKEITYELGFEDPAYFCRVFKKHTGFSPLEYRQNAGQ